jgi:DNA-3-methyladenine glycosylase II
MGGKMTPSSFTLTPTPPYDFARTIRASRYTYTLGVVHGDVYRRLLHVGDGIALVEVSSVGTVEQPQLEARLLASIGLVDEARIARAVRRLMNLDADLSLFYAVAQDHLPLRETVALHYGLHALQADTMFEAVALTIIEQQIALLTAQKAERWLAQTYGDSLTYEGETYYSFPTAAQIAPLTIDDLTPLKITFRRMQVLIDLARLAVTGALDLEGLREGTPADAYRALMAVKGIGHWTSSWAITRGLGAFAYVGSSDVALQAAVNRYFYDLPGRVTPALVDETFASFGEFAGAAAFYILLRWATEKY